MTLPANLIYHPHFTYERTKLRDANDLALGKANLYPWPNSDVNPSHSGFKASADYRTTSQSLYSKQPKPNQPTNQLKTTLSHLTNYTANLQ